MKVIFKRCMYVLYVIFMVEINAGSSENTGCTLTLVAE